MTLQKLGRGRPKGTGLNDNAHLLAMAGLLAAEPELKPTTAIRKLGINDPSVIRRLRDKYHAMEPQLRADMTAGVAGAVANAAQEIRVARAAPLTAPREIIRAEAPMGPVEAPVVPVVALVAPIVAPVTPMVARETNTPPAPVVNTAPSAAVATPPAVAPAVSTVRRASTVARPSETELPALMGAGLSLFMLAFEAQYAMMGNLMQWSPLGAAMKSQAKMLESSVAMMAPRRQPVGSW